MKYQPNRDRFRNIGNKSLDIREHQIADSLVNTKQSLRSKLKTQSVDYSNLDSLQLFQQQLNWALKGTKSKNKPKKQVYTSGARDYSSKQTIELKNEVNQIKNMLESEAQLKSVEQKLQKLLVQLEGEKLKRKASTPIANINPLGLQAMQNPMYIPQQQMYPQPYSYPYPYPYPYPPAPQQRGFPPRRKPRRRDYDENSQSDQQQQPRRSDRSQLTKRSNYSRKPKNNVNRKQKIRTKLRVYLYTVVFTIFIRSQAKKLSNYRKNNSKKFWTDKFDSQINNLKNWLLDSQKFSLSIILEKKHLPLNFTQDKSDRVKEQKHKLILQIVNIGLNKMQEQCTTQKVSLFSQILLNLCRRGSFAPSRFWTVYQLEQICISEYFGFFRIDPNLQKYLIGILVFIKVFVFNMFLQPSKFDVNNFPKKLEPITTNMKVISSVYYQMAKQVINEYKNEERDADIYKIGNWLEVKKQFIIECCEPLIYGNNYPENQEYISGLLTEEDMNQLRQEQIWGLCTQKIKKIIEKLHVQMMAKDKLVKKNLKYKLYK